MRRLTTTAPLSSIKGKQSGLKLILIWSVCYILIKFEKKYYKIENERITLWQEDKLLLELKSSDIMRRLTTTAPLSSIKGKQSGLKPLCSFVIT